MTHDYPKLLNRIYSSTKATKLQDLMLKKMAFLSLAILLCHRLVKPASAQCTAATLGGRFVGQSVGVEKMGLLHLDVPEAMLTDTTYVPVTERRAR